MAEQLRYLDRGRLSIVAGALLLALALSRLLEGPVRPLLRVTVFGSPLGFDLSAPTIMSLIIVGLAITGVSALLQSHPLAQAGPLNRRYMFWIVPGLMGIALAEWLNRIENPSAWAAALLGSGVLLPFLLLVEYSAFDQRQRRQPWLQWSQMALIHLAAVILFTLIYNAGTRTLLSGPAVFITTTLLAARLFWITRGNLNDAFSYGAIAGLILGQMTWMLNYWRLSGLQGGLLLLLLFYAVVGLIQQFLQGQFGRRVVYEYGAVTLIALLLIGLAVP